MGVPDPEELVALPLYEQRVAELGGLARGGGEHGPGDGVGPVPREHVPVAAGDGRDGELRTGPDALQRLDPCDGGPYEALARLPGRRVRDLDHHCAAHVTHQPGGGNGTQRKIQEPGPGDLDTLDPGHTAQPAGQHLGDLGRPHSGTLRDLEGDGSGVLPHPTGPGPLDHHPRRRRPGQLAVLDGAAHGAYDATGKVGGGHGTQPRGDAPSSVEGFRHVNRALDNRHRRGERSTGGDRPSPSRRAPLSSRRCGPCARSAGARRVPARWARTASRGRRPPRPRSRPPPPAAYRR